MVGACSSTEEVTTPPTPTTAPVQQPAPAATAMPGAPAATAMPGATATPRPTAALAGEPKYGGIALFSTRGDLVRGADLMRSTTITKTQVVEAIFGYGNLVRACQDDPYDRTCLGLAESWEANADFTQWTFKIRENVLWHDGTPLTAEDIRWWFDVSVNGVEGRQPSRRDIDFGDIASLAVLDGDRLQVTLNRPTPQYFLGLGDPQVILAHPRHLIEPEFDKRNTDAGPIDIDFVGTGPFKFLRYAKGSVFSVRRFGDYWKKDDKGRQLPYLDGIDFPIIGDRETMVAALRAGRIGGGSRGDGTALEPAQMEVIKKTMGDEVFFLIGRTAGKGMGFNVTLDIVDNATNGGRRCAGDYSITVADMSEESIFPETLLRSVAGVAFNECARFRTDDTKVDEFYPRLGRATSRGERIAIANEMERYALVEKVYLIGSWDQINIRPFRSYVKGLLAQGPQQNDYLNHALVWLDK